MSPQSPAGIEVVGHVPTLLVWPIVRAEKDDGVLIDSVLFKGLENPSDSMIEGSHHPRKLGGWILGKGPVVSVAPHLVLEFGKLFPEGSRIFLRNVHGGVRDGDRQKAEEWAFVIPVDPLNCPVHDEIMGVGFPI